MWDCTSTLHALCVSRCIAWKLKTTDVLQVLFSQLFKLLLGKYAGKVQMHMNLIGTALCSWRFNFVVSLLSPPLEEKTVSWIQGASQSDRKGLFFSRYYIICLDCLGLVSFSELLYAFYTTRNTAENYIMPLLDYIQTWIPWNQFVALCDFRRNFPLLPLSSVSFEQHFFLRWQQLY